MKPYPEGVSVRWTPTGYGWMSRKEAKRRGLVETKKQKARVKKILSKRAEADR